MPAGTGSLYDNYVSCGDVMSLSAGGSGERWFSQLPRTGRIYSLIDEAGSTGDRDARIAAIIALGESGDPRAVDMLVHCCSDSNPVIRMHAVRALGKIRSGRSVTALRYRLADKNELLETRLAAVTALAGVRCDSAIDGLRECGIGQDEDPAVRSEIERALNEIQAREVA